MIESLFEKIPVIVTVVSCIVVSLLITAAMYRPAVTCKFCGKKMSAKKYDVHFCGEKYVEYSKKAAKATGGTVHSIRKLEPGKGWVSIETK